MDGLQLFVMSHVNQEDILTQVGQIRHCNILRVLEEGRQGRYLCIKWVLNDSWLNNVGYFISDDKRGKAAE